MSRTKKIQAARLLYKQIKDIPQEMREEVNKLSYHGGALRLGHSRHMKANMKVKYRRIDKAKRDVEIQKKIKEQLIYG